MQMAYLISVKDAISMWFAFMSVVKRREWSLFFNVPCTQFVRGAGQVKEIGHFVKQIATFAYLIVSISNQESVLPGFWSEQFSKLCMT